MASSGRGTPMPTILGWMTLLNQLDRTGRSMSFEAGGLYAPESFARLEDSAAVPAMSR
jgi:hypothetical protein